MKAVVIKCQRSKEATLYCLSRGYEKLLHNGEVDISDIPSEIRINNQSFYMYAFRCVTTCDEFNKVFRILEGDMVHYLNSKCAFGLLTLREMARDRYCPQSK